MLKEGTLSITNSAFYECSNLASITIPNSVTTIGKSAFYKCTGLTSISIGNGVVSIGGSAFSGCPNIEEIVVATGNTVYDSRDNCNAIIVTATNELMLGCKATVIPNSVTSIRSQAFSDCTGLTSVTIPNSVTEVDNFAFFGCSNLEKIVISSGNTVYDSRDNCNAIVVTATNELIIGCKTTVIPNSVTSIGGSAFQNCSGLTTITIPNSVINIGDCAFYDCNRLASFIMCRKEPISINSIVFRSVAKTTLYVPKNSKALYSNSAVWKDFKTITEYPNPDVNEDSYVDVVDVVDIARYIVGTSSLPLISVLADLNQDKIVSVADAVLVVKEIVGETNWTRRFNGVSDNRGVLTLTHNDDRSLSLCMEDDGQYTAFQFDLMVPEDGDVRMQLNTLRRQGHQLIYNKVGDGHYRVVALSLNNNAFSGQQGEVLNIQLDGLDGRSVTLDNIHFVTLRGTDHRFDALSASGATTGVQGASAREQGASAVYRLDGTKQRDSQRGVSIVKGKKYVRK